MVFGSIYSCRSSPCRRRRWPVDRTAPAFGMPRPDSAAIVVCGIDRPRVIAGYRVPEERDPNNRILSCKSCQNSGSPLPKLVWGEGTVVVLGKTLPRPTVTAETAHSLPVSWSGVVRWWLRSRWSPKQLAHKSRRTVPCYLLPKIRYGVALSGCLPIRLGSLYSASRSHLSAA